MTTKRKLTPAQQREKILEDRCLDACKMYEKAREPFGRLIEVATAVNNDLRSGRLPIQAPSPVCENLDAKREIARLEGYIREMQTKIDRLLQARQP